jgi:hypothetical protein
MILFVIVLSPAARIPEVAPPRQAFLYMVEFVITEDDPQKIPPVVSAAFPLTIQFAITGDASPHEIPPTDQPPLLPVILQLEITGEYPAPLIAIPPAV